MLARRPPIHINIVPNWRTLPVHRRRRLGGHLLTIPVRRHDWELMPETIKGSIFLLSLVLCASMMPVEALPPASWQSAFTLGFVSAVFDNIPLTALALRQGGFDWGFLAYAVGFGGSMLWFGSSAGVALSNMYPEAKSAAQWLRHGWHVAVAYVVGFMVMLAVLGWHPDTGHRKWLTGRRRAPAVSAPRNNLVLPDCGQPEKTAKNEIKGGFGRLFHVGFATKNACFCAPIQCQKNNTNYMIKNKKLAI
jgi:hypothetical protein